MKPGLLIIFSGLPGSGKSTLASRLASKIRATYVRIDTVEQGLRDICEISQIEGKGDRLSYRIAQENLRLGNTVIADSVNAEEFVRKEWNAVASEVGASFINVEVSCTDKVEHKRRVEERPPSVPGLKPPTWNEVLNREYHEWSEDRIAVETGGKTPEESLEQLLTALKARV